MRATASTGTIVSRPHLDLHVHRALRRWLTTGGASLALLAVLAAPAWAAPSFTSGGQAEAGAEGHPVTMQVPDVEQTGPTAKVTVTAPAGFTPSACVGPVGWQCLVEGRRITWTRGAIGQLGTFGFQLTVPAAAGDYPFPVVQTGDAGTANWTPGNGAPVLSVTAADPPPDGGEGEGEGTDEDPPAGGTEDPTPDQGGTEPAASGQQDAGQDETTGASPAPAPDADASEATDPADQDTAGEDTSSDAGTAPTRTQGRSSGTTLEITPGEQTAGAQDPSVAAPDVAEEAAPSSTPSDVAGDAGTAVAGAASSSGQPGRDVQWQQLVGAALLAVGGGIVGVRRWRSR